MKAAITAYPYAIQYGTLEMPDDIERDFREEYITEHWSEIKFGEPELDYAGTDMEVMYIKSKEDK